MLVFPSSWLMRKKLDQKPTRESVSSSCLAGPYAFVSVMEDSIDSSIEVLDDSQDLSWELAEGGTWRESNKLNGKVEKKELFAKQNFHVKGAAQAKLSKRKQAPLASDDLETVYCWHQSLCGGRVQERETYEYR